MFQLIETKTLVIENLVKPNLKLFKNKSHVTWFKNDYVKSYIYTFNLIYFSSIIIKRDNKFLGLIAKFVLLFWSLHYIGPHVF